MKKNDLKVLNKKYIDPLGIGFMCVGCTGSSEKVMEAHIYDLDNIIRLGKYDRAKIAAEVLLERGIEPHEAANNYVYPTIEKMLDELQEATLNKVRISTSLLSAIYALESIEKEAGISGVTVIRGELVFAGSGERLEDPDIILAKAAAEAMGFSVREISFGNEEGVIENTKILLDEIKNGKINKLFVDKESFKQDTVDEIAALAGANPQIMLSIFSEDSENTINTETNRIFCCSEPLFGVKMLMNITK